MSDSVPVTTEPTFLRLPTRHGGEFLVRVDAIDGIEQLPPYLGESVTRITVRSGAVFQTTIPLDEIETMLLNTVFE